LVPPTSRAQFAHENEIIFPPLTGLEVTDTTVDCSTLIVSSKMSLNLLSQTLEQVLSRRRKLLGDMATNMRIELHNALNGSGFEAAGARMLNDELEGSLLRNDPEWYNEVRALGRGARVFVGRLCVYGCGRRAAGRPL
jgi:hypothetical protein